MRAYPSELSVIAIFMLCVSGGTFSVLARGHGGLPARQDAAGPALTGGNPSATASHLDLDMSVTKPGCWVPVSQVIVGRPSIPESAAHTEVNTGEGRVTIWPHQQAFPAVPATAITTLGAFDLFIYVSPILPDAAPVWARRRK